MTQAELLKQLIIDFLGNFSQQDSDSWEPVDAKLTLEDGSVLYISTLCGFPRQMDTT